MANEGITAGSIIRFTNESINSLELMSDHHGTLSHPNGSSDMNLSAGDQLFIFQTDNNLYNGVMQRLNSNNEPEPGMIYAFNGDNTQPNTHGWLDAGNSHTSSASQLPPNMTALTTSDGSGNASIANANGMLVNGDVQVLNPSYETAPDEFDNYRYDGPVTQATKEEWLIRLHTTSNWQAGDSDTLGIYSGSLSSEIKVLPANSTPSLSIDGGTLNYTENQGPVQLAPAANANDIDGDTDWNGGILTVQVTSNNQTSDQLSIPDNVVGTINTTNNDLLDGNTIIGSINAIEGTVTNGTLLSVTFNSNISNNLVQQVVRAIHYTNTSEDPVTSARTVTFTLTDANSASAIATRIISVFKADNDRPTITVNNELSLDEGASELINALTNLSANDVDDDHSVILFSISNEPANGHIENTDSPGIAITSFTQLQLDNGKIRYTHNGTNTTSDSFKFSVTDDGNNKLTDQTFSIKINSIDDDAPTITTNNGLSIQKGSTESINLTSLAANDTESDNATIVYSITTQVVNGRMENTNNQGVSINTFTQQDLTDGLIQYVHNGSATTEDYFIFKVIDASLNELTNQYFNIAISTPTSVEEQRHNQIKVYPNPAATKVDVTTASSIVKVSVYSQTGKMIAVPTSRNNDKWISMQVSHLSKGTYLLQVKTKEGLSTHKLVVK
ncbi:MAG: T9SS type A sorting domain-containing protein [Bacteroidales bacterium]|nr:T9SS type A sorting domain-containing protein [Bacteroidales bacterium]